MRGLSCKFYQFFIDDEETLEYTISVLAIRFKGSISRWELDNMPFPKLFMLRDHIIRMDNEIEQEMKKR